MTVSTVKHYHLAGVGGVGMSALAQVLLDLGHRVSGSDRYLDQACEPDVVSRLRRGGLSVFAQNGSGLDGRPDALVVSTAIEPDNPELAAAQKAGIPVFHRAELLAQLTRGGRCLAVSGTSGKTTVTGMIGWILEQAGLDPNVINGGECVNWAGGDHLGSVRTGSSDIWVVEADESDKSLLRLDPEWALITNISRDHFGLAETRALFQSFAAKTRRRLICDPETAGLLAPSAGVRSVRPELRQEGGQWSCVLDGEAFTTALPGRHNALNAAFAAEACMEFGVAARSVRAGLETFRGMRRRLESVGSARRVTVIDDYAHNPAKIEAAWTASRELGRRVIGLWRPHGFTPLAAMMDELAAAFDRLLSSDDILILLPVYFAGGTVARTVSSKDLAARLASHAGRVHVVQDYEAAAELILGSFREIDVVLCMGARDPELPLFARRLVKLLARGRR